MCTMPKDIRDLDLLEVHAANALAGPLPECPRLSFSGSPRGNVIGVHRNIDPILADRLRRIGGPTPAWVDPERLPESLEALAEILRLARPVKRGEPDIVYSLPNGLSHVATDVRIVASDGLEGEHLLERLSRTGMPQPLLDAGFEDITHLWPPWCVAMVGEEIVSLAFTVRISEAAAEIGVYTLAAFRGRGLAAAVTANWSAFPSLRNRCLFYGTHPKKLSSQRVTDRLGLRRLGLNMTLY
jgi:hypothetical protein